MRQINNQLVKIANSDQIKYRIVCGQLVITISDARNTIDLSFPICNGQLFETLGEMRADVAKAITTRYLPEIDDPLLLLSIEK